MLTARLIDYILTKTGKIPPKQEDDNGEIYSFEKKPMMPNILMIIGLVLIVGVTAPLFGEAVRYGCGITGTGFFIVGYFLKRKSVVK